MYPEGFDQSTMHNKPICGILAVAIAAGVKYDVAFAACKRNMPAHRQRMRGSTYDSQRDKALSQLAVKFTVYDKDKVRHYSVLDFCANNADNGVVYLLEIRGHVVTLKNGFIIDQHACVPWQQYKHPRIKLKRVVQIDGKGWP